MNSVTKLQSRSESAPQYDAGLRAYLLKVYNYMAVALLVTGAVAFFAAGSDAFLNSVYTMQGNLVVGTKPLGWVVMLAPLGLVIWMSFGLPSMSLPALQLIYWIYAVAMGLSLSVIFLTFTGESIARVFFITAGMFGGMSLYGYTTKRDLTGLGSFLMMGLIGLIIASLVNLFLKSAGLQFVLSVLGVMIFVGLTAYDTQKLKAIYYEYADTADWKSKLAIMGALSLYLDFINIFVSLLNIMGERKR